MIVKEGDKIPVFTVKPIMEIKKFFGPPFVRFEYHVPLDKNGNIKFESTQLELFPTP